MSLTPASDFRVADPAGTYARGSMIEAANASYGHGMAHLLRTSQSLGIEARGLANVVDALGLGSGTTHPAATQKVAAAPPVTGMAPGTA